MSKPRAHPESAPVACALPAHARRRRMRGFTLLEQTVVLATVGVLSATALPRLADWHSDAEGLALAAVAGAVGTAVVLNQGVCAVRGASGPGAGANPGPADGVCLPMRDCRDAAALLATPLPAGYQLLPQPLQAAPGSAHPAEADCAIVHSASGARATFRGIAAGS